LQAAMEDEDEAAELPQYKRDYFYNVKIGPNRWLHIPKPCELAIPAAGLERSIRYARGHKDAFDDFSQSIGSELMTLRPEDMAGPFRGVIQLAANKDMFRDREIVPFYEQGLPVKDRVGTEYASRVGQAIQSAIGVDARQADFFMREYFGNIADTALKLSDVGREGKPGLGETLVRESGVVGPSPSFSAANVDRAKRMAESMGEGGASFTRPLREALDLVAESETPEDQDKAAEAARATADRMIEALSIEGVADALRGATVSRGADRAARRLRDAVGRYIEGRSDNKDAIANIAQTLSQRNERDRLAAIE